MQGLPPRDGFATLPPIGLAATLPGILEGMNLLESRLYRWMDVLANYFFLNLLWLIVCLPLITLFPATAALFAVVRDWSRGKEAGFFMPFLRYMRENFVQSLVVGLAWAVVGLILVVDFLFVREIESWIQTPLFVLFSAMALAYLGTAVYLFPVMVHYRMSWLQVIKNSFLIALTSPMETALCLAIVVLAGLTVIYFPVSFLIMGSLMAYLIYRLTDRAFQKVTTMPDGEASPLDQ